MREKLMGEMGDFEFREMMEAFVDRPALDDQIPAELVFAMLDKAEQPEQTLGLQSAIVGDRLVLFAPPGVTVPASVREIEIDLPSVHELVSLPPVPA